MIVDVGHAVGEWVLRPEAAVEEPGMARVDVALQRLHPVALPLERRKLHVVGVDAEPFEVRHRRRRLPAAHVRPDHAAGLPARIGALTHLVPEVALSGLARHVHAAPAHVVLPAVVDAAQAAGLVPSEEQRGSAVGAVFLHETNAPLGVAEDDQILAQQTDALRVAARVRDLGAEHHREPVLAQQTAHRRPGAYAGQQFVVFLGEHGAPRRAYGL